MQGSGTDQSTRYCGGTRMFTGISLLLLSTLLPLNLTASAFPSTPKNPIGSLCDTTDSDFYEYRYEEGIPYCVRSVSSNHKKRIYKKYKISKKCRHKYTIDHTIPLALGGNNSTKNLWPEHKSIKALRQNLEVYLYRQILNGEISQENAVQTILWAKNNPPLEEIELDQNDRCDRGLKDIYKNSHL